MKGNVRGKINSGISIFPQQSGWSKPGFRIRKRSTDGDESREFARRVAIKPSI